MKKKSTDKVITDPGNMTMGELKRQMRNSNEIPIWQMHPLVQHCLRVYQELQPDNVEWKSKDACKWIESIHSSASMFLGVYRVKSFRVNFIKNNTMYFGWHKHRCI